MEGDALLNAFTARRMFRDIYTDNQERVPMFTVYGPDTTDYPGRYTVRPSLTLPVLRRYHLVYLAESLDAVRVVVPRDAHRLDRQPGDDPSIIEVWL